MTMKELKMDLKERFLNYETAKGLYFVLAGLITVYVSVFYQQYVIQVLGVTWGWYSVSEGLRKIFVNRIKQAVKQEELQEEHKNVVSAS